MTRWRAKVTLLLTPVVAVLSGACDRADSPRMEAAQERVFDAERAYADLVAQVRIGPRPAGSTGSERTRQLIRQRLRQAGWRVEDHDFLAQLPDSESVQMTNLIARLAGERAKQIALGTHYDTKRLPEASGFLGANDGASGVAVLLELARMLALERRAWSYTMFFFDGEEAVGRRINQTDGLFGSRALAQELAESGEMSSLAAFVVIDMVGDADLNLSVDAQTAPEIAALLSESARELGVEHVLDGSMRLLDDHTPFVRRGLRPVIALIDFQYGARWTPGPRWHTSGDGLDGVSAQSLNIVGPLLVEFLGKLEVHLDSEEGENRR